jgi:hypothetical protein
MAVTHALQEGIWLISSLKHLLIHYFWNTPLDCSLYLGEGVCWHCIAFSHYLVILFTFGTILSNIFLASCTLWYICMLILWCHYLSFSCQYLHRHLDSVDISVLFPNITEVCSTFIHSHRLTLMYTSCLLCVRYLWIYFCSQT